MIGKFLFLILFYSVFSGSAYAGQAQFQVCVNQCHAGFMDAQGAGHEAEQQCISQCQQHLTCDPSIGVAWNPRASACRACPSGSYAHGSANGQGTCVCDNYPAESFSVATWTCSSSCEDGFVWSSDASSCIAAETDCDDEFEDCSEPEAVDIVSTCRGSNYSEPSERDCSSIRGQDRSEFNRLFAEAESACNSTVSSLESFCSGQASAAEAAAGSAGAVPEGAGMCTAASSTMSSIQGAIPQVSEHGDQCASNGGDCRSVCSQVRYPPGYGNFTGTPTNASSCSTIVEQTQRKVDTQIAALEQRQVETQNIVAQCGETPTTPDPVAGSTVPIGDGTFNAPVAASSFVPIIPGEIARGGNFQSTGGTLPTQSTVGVAQGNVGFPSTGGFGEFNPGDSLFGNRSSLNSTTGSSGLGTLTADDPIFNGAPTSNGGDQSRGNSAAPQGAGGAPGAARAGNLAAAAAPPAQSGKRGNQRRGYRSPKADKLVGGFKNPVPTGGNLGVLAGKGKGSSGSAPAATRAAAYQIALNKFGKGIPLKFKEGKYVPDIEKIKASMAFKRANSRVAGLHQGRDLAADSIDENAIRAFLEGEGVRYHPKGSIFNYVTTNFKRLEVRREFEGVDL